MIAQILLLLAAAVLLCVSAVLFFAPETPMTGWTT